MATGTFSKVADFIEGQMEAVGNLATGTLMIALSNTAAAAEASNPLSSGNGVLANVTQISYTNYSDDLTVDRTLQSVTSNESGGTYTLDAADFTITASGGTLATFQYIYLYNDTPTSPADPLIGYWALDSAISLANGESLAVSFNASGIFTVA